jgi:hypothetical protein
MKPLKHQLWNKIKQALSSKPKASKDSILTASTATAHNDAEAGPSESRNLQVGPKDPNAEQPRLTAPVPAHTVDFSAQTTCETTRNPQNTPINIVAVAIVENTGTIASQKDLSLPQPGRHAINVATEDLKSTPCTDLWDRAYELLRSRDEPLVEKYEKILEEELRASIASKAVLGSVTAVAMSVRLGGENSSATGIQGAKTTSAATSLATLGTPMRQEQMKALVQSKTEKNKESAINRVVRLIKTSMINSRPS